MTTLPILETPSCEGCGACCMDQAAPPMYAVIYSELAVGDPDRIRELEEGEFTAEDVKRVRNLPDEATESLAEYLLSPVMQPLYFSPCIWLDQSTMRCRFYEHRPSICRDFDPGCVECHGWRSKWTDAATN
jgi:Fe-S-cluster containining protein